MPPIVQQVIWRNVGEAYFPAVDERVLMMKYPIYQLTVSSLVCVSTVLLRTLEALK